MIAKTEKNGLEYCMFSPEVHDVTESQAVIFQWLAEYGQNQFYHYKDRPALYEPASDELQGTTIVTATSEAIPYDQRVKKFVENVDGLELPETDMIHHIIVVISDNCSKHPDDIFYNIRKEYGFEDNIVLKYGDGHDPSIIIIEGHERQRTKELGAEIAEKCQGTYGSDVSAKTELGLHPEESILDSPQRLETGELLTTRLKKT